MNWHTLQRPLREALLEDDGDGGDCFRGEDRKKFFRKKKKKSLEHIAAGKPRTLNNWR